MTPEPHRGDRSASALSALQATVAVKAYLADVVDACGAPGSLVVSLILFGSAATGGYAMSVSDVDLLLVIRDGADEAERHAIRDAIADLEARHGLARSQFRRRGSLSDALKRFADRVSANVRAFLA